MDWLQNAWVTGIGGGIVSGLIVYFITAWLFSNQSKRDAARKVSSANQEITLAVRQGIPENRIPSRPVLDALIKATARKHSLQAAELYGPGEVAQDLIKEVMDSSFISAEAKEGYCERLAELDRSETNLDRATAGEKRASIRSPQTAVISLALAMSAAIMSATLVLVMREGGMDAFDKSRSVTISILLPVVAMGMSALIALTLVTVERIRRRRVDNFFLISASANSKKYDRHVEHVVPQQE
jgi:hypothetical protein